MGSIRRNEADRTGLQSPENGSMKVRGLPSPPNQLIGRERDLVEVEACLRLPNTRLLTLTGSPGTGKTRLAIALAESVAEGFDEAAWVELAPLADPEIVPQAIAEQIGVGEAGSRRHAELLTDYLGSKNILLVLDNFEQVLGAATFVADVLSRCPKVRFVITSRVPLHIRWEREFVVGPLEVPSSNAPGQAQFSRIPSVQLFVERAVSVRPDFALSEKDQTAVAEICRQLDGLPLAIELAAGRSKVLEPAALSARLERRFDLLKDGPRDLPERQRTLRGAVGWSYSLLSSEEQSLFRRLAVFPNGCEIEDAEAICAGGGVNVVDAIYGLANANLVQFAASQSGPRRLRMLETIREYGVECLDSTNERAKLEARHATRYLELVEQSEEGLTGSTQPYWLERLEAEHANLLRALHYFVDSGDAKSSARMVNVLWRFWWRRGYLTEGRRQTANVLAMESIAGSDELRLTSMVAAGLLALWQADYEEARTLLVESTILARKLQEQRALAYSLVFLGRVARDHREANAADLCAEGVETFRSTGDNWGLGVGLHFLGLAVTEFDLELATQYFQDSIKVFQSLGVQGDLAMPLRGMGLVCFLLGRHEEARKYFEESAALFRGIRDEWSAAMVLHDVGSLAERQGSPKEAAALLTESLRAWQKIGNRRGILICLAALARLALQVGAGTLAVQLLATVDSAAAKSGVAFEPTDYTKAEVTLSRAREVLHPSAYSMAWQEGRELDFDAAIASGFLAGELVAKQKSGVAPQEPKRLSPREREVAALLRRGMTNREIAEQLVITDGTANLHVKHILAKLSFSNRAQVAAWMAEQERSTSDS
jgi:non-specific serine/threonine protein kinase